MGPRAESDAIECYHGVDGLSARRDKGGNPMLWYCRFQWQPAATRQQVAQRVVQQHDAGMNHPERIKGWYNLVGGGAGFLLVEYDDPRELTAFLQPFMDLMSFDVRGVYQLDYEQRIAELRQVATQ